MLLTLLFLFICFAFTVFYVLKKSTIFSLIGGALWFLFVIYSYPNSTGWDFYRGLALLGTLMALLSWIMPFVAWREHVEEEEPEEEEYVASITRQRDELRGKANRLRRKDDLL